MGNRKNEKIIPRVRTTIRVKGYSYSTEKTYVYWIVKFIKFKKYESIDLMLRCPEEDISDFLSYLAKVKLVSSSTQNQALNALVFLYGFAFCVLVFLFVSFIFRCFNFKYCQTPSTHKHSRTKLHFSSDTNINQYPPPFPELQLQASSCFKRDSVSLTFVLYCVK